MSDWVLDVLYILLALIAIKIAVTVLFFVMLLLLFGTGFL